jgi:adenosylcobinamide-GDP ribazoletransferase
MGEFYRGLKFMLAYFTILPVRFRDHEDLSRPSVLGAMLFFLPLGGIIIGTMSIGVYLALASLDWLGALVGAAVYMMLYGFLHTEAVIDTADARYAAHSGKDPYTIIKDPTVGAMGILWAGALLVLKLAALSYLLLHGAYGTIIATLIISRMLLQALFITETFRSSFVTQIQAGFTPKLWGIAAGVFGLVGIAIAQGHFLVLLLIGMSAGYFLSKSIGRKLGFLNGDVLGATLEGVELLLFLLGAILWQ